MGVMRRMFVASAVTVGAAVTGLLWTDIGLQLVERARAQDGPFSPIADQVATLFPLVLSLLVVAIWVWVIAAGVQRQVDDRRRVQR